MNCSLLLYHIDIKLLTTTPDIVQIYDLLVSYDTYDDTVLFSILNALSFMMIHAENKNIFQSLHSKLDVYFNHNDIRISTIANNMHDILHS